MQKNFKSHQCTQLVRSEKGNAVFPTLWNEFLGDATYLTVSNCNRRTEKSHKSFLSNTVGATPGVRHPLFWMLCPYQFGETISQAGREHGYGIIETGLTPS